MTINRPMTPAPTPANDSNDLAQVRKETETRRQEDINSLGKTNGARPTGN